VVDASERKKHRNTCLGSVRVSQGELEQVVWDWNILQRSDRRLARLCKSFSGYVRYRIGLGFDEDAPKPRRCHTKKTRAKKKED